MYAGKEKKNPPYLKHCLCPYENDTQTYQSFYIQGLLDSGMSLVYICSLLCVSESVEFLFFGIPLGHAVGGPKKPTGMHTPLHAVCAILVCFS